MEEAEFLARMVVHGSDSPEAAAAHVRAFFTALCEAARHTRRIGPVLGLFHTQPICGGAFDERDPAGTAENAGVSRSLQLSREVIANLRKGLAMQRTDAKGDPARGPAQRPVVTSP